MRITTRSDVWGNYHLTMSAPPPRIIDGRCDLGDWGLATFWCNRYRDGSWDWHISFTGPIERILLPHHELRMNGNEPSRPYAERAAVTRIEELKSEVFDELAKKIKGADSVND